MCNTDIDIDIDIDIEKDIDIELEIDKEKEIEDKFDKFDKCFLKENEKNFAMSLFCPNGWCIIST